MHLLVKVFTLEILSRIFSGPGRARTAYLFIANEVFNQLNFRPAAQSVIHPKPEIKFREESAEGRYYFEVFNREIYNKAFFILVRLWRNPSITPGQVLQFIFLKP